MVPRGKIMEAQQLIEEATKAGPEAAAAGELASEEEK
jgi:predicted transcriptional regulator